MIWNVWVQKTQSLYTGKTTHVFVTQLRKPGRKVAERTTRREAFRHALGIVEATEATGARARLTIERDNED